jgi:hypothetical protein
MLQTERLATSTIFENTSFFVTCYAERFERCRHHVLIYGAMQEERKLKQRLMLGFFHRQNAHFTDDILLLK